jgi:hypothetical protein
MNLKLSSDIWGVMGFLAVITATAVAAAQPAPEVQGAAPVSPSATPPAPQRPTAAPQPAPAAAPAPIPVVPPGYMLVPIAPAPPPSGYPATTNYDVQYPQFRGALPPGMELPYQEGEPVPPGYRVIEQKRRGLIIAGSLTAGIPWALGVAVASGANFEDKTGWLTVPVLGPWLMIAAGGADEEKNCDSTVTSDCYDDHASVRGVLALDGLVQAAGAVMFVCGMAIPRKRLVREDVTVSMLPTRVGRDGYGMGFVGSF